MINKFCLFGHVDSGKSTCAGHILLKCKYIDEHTFENIKKNTKSERQLFSNIVDIDEEEQIRGKTREYITINFEFNGKKFELIDTPGHKTYISEMINGISASNPEKIVGVLLISMAKGEFESGWNGGQTKEDLLIIRSLGIKNLIILYNKMDSIDWDYDIFHKTCENIMSFIKKLKFQKIIHLPVSGFKGIGLIEKSNFSDKSLLEIIEELQPQLSISQNSDFIENKIFEMCSIDFRLFTNGIYAEGFMGVIHFQGQESEFIIEKIKGKKFIKHIEDKIINEKIIIKLKKPLKIKYDGKIMLLRFETKTLGFGKIIQIIK